MQDDRAVEAEEKEGAVDAGTSEASAAASELAATTESGDATTLEARIKQLEANLKEREDAWLRAKADAENIRKRSQQEVANAYKFSVESFSSELLAVKDALEAALTVENATLESMRDGVELTLKQLSNVFEKFNIKEINPAGEKFDPHKHQAIGMVDGEGGSNTVVSILQKGYEIHDRILRPALVMVAK